MGRYGTDFPSRHEYIYKVSKYSLIKTYSVGGSIIDSLESDFIPFFSFIYIQ